MEPVRPATHRIDEESSQKYLPFIVMEDLYEKLKLLDYFREFPRLFADVAPINKHYFALKSDTPHEQLFTFVCICAWLVRRCGLPFEPLPRRRRQRRRTRHRRQRHSREGRDVRNHVDDDDDDDNRNIDDDDGADDDGLVGWRNGRREDDSGIDEGEMRAAIASTLYALAELGIDEEFNAARLQQGWGEQVINVVDALADSFEIVTFFQRFFSYII